MSEIEYVQQTGRPGPGRDDNYFNYKAIGPESNGRRPFAVVYGNHRKAEFAPTFDERSPATGGLSNAFLRHKHDQLMVASWDRDLTPEETNAVTAVKHFLHRKNVHEPEKTPWALNELQTNPHLVPDKLFEQTESPAIHIGGMFADPSMKTAALTLTGMAYDQHNRDTIEASHDLSRHSSRLVQKAMKRGMPVVGEVSNPTAKVTNTVGFTPLTMSVRKYNDEIVLDPDVRRSTPEEVSRGKGAVREMLRSTKPRNPQPVAKTLSDQFLPGMKKYVK